MHTSYPKQLSDHVTAFGNDHIRHYLVGKDRGVLVECGVTASANQFARQLAHAGRRAPDKLLVMHAHFDHVCGIPALRGHFQDAEVLASPEAARVLDNPKVVASFFDQDRKITNGLVPEAHGTDALPPQRRIAVHRTVGGGDRIALADGAHLEMIAAPGHSPCSLAAWFDRGRVLFVSDSLGFQISDDTIFPVFFHAYRPYVETIERLAQYPADVLAVPHERIWREKEVDAVFSRALSAARDLREEIVSAVDRGREPSDLKQTLFNRFYSGDLRIYTPENIRMCVDLLVRRSIESR
jgi:glyoxylase-like metal-dependent hydrolase (beta-lactamase superfamily II)